MTAGNEPRPDLDATLLEERAEDLYEHAPCGYLSTLPDGTIVKVNGTLVEWTGFPREALLQGMRFPSLLSIGSKIYYETHYAPLLRMQGFANEIAMEIVRADGRKLPVLVNARQRRSADGTPLFNRITVFDATDRRRYEEELLLARRKAEQVAKDKADLLAMLSHDIRNPLNALMGTVRLLDRTDLTETQRRYVRLLHSSSENMLSLLNHVLDWSRIESAGFALVAVPFSPRTVVEGVLATFEALARDKGLTLSAAVDEAVPPAVVGDPVAVSQILTNFVANAVKFTTRGTVSVTVGAREAGPGAVTLAFAVTDTGIGIAPELIERIFGEFTQASYETALQFGGTGLGLAIARRILTMHGSTAEVDSEPGRGSTFSFALRLPLPPDPPAG